MQPDRLSISRFFGLSVGAAASILLLPIALLVWDGFGPPVFNDDGTVWNAPIRSAGILLSLVPMVYGITVAVVYVVTRLLALLHCLSWRNLFVGAAGVSFSGAVAAFLGVDPGVTMTERVTNAMFTSAALMICLGSGAIVWWWVASRLHNNPMQPTAGSGG